MASARGNEPLFFLASYARRGPGRRDRLSPGEIAQISRTVRRAPEVMVKVLSRGGQDLKAVGCHIDYLRDREEGELEVEMDDGRQLSGKGAAKELLEDWDLKLEAYRNRSGLGVRGGGSQKLVHKLLFSMPAGIPPEKVLAAVKNLAREEFGLRHRYAMVLHTDEPHPHVHMVLKAVSERGERLHIRKATLREWRREFARHLREQGVPANATERAVRGETKTPKLDGIYRAMHDPKRRSTHMQRRAEEVVSGTRLGRPKIETGKASLLATRGEVERGWQAVQEILAREGHVELASTVLRFVDAMPLPRTEKEQIAAQMEQSRRELQLDNRPPPVR